MAIQRALALGAAQLSNARQLAAGDAFPRAKESWRKLAGSKDALSTEYPSQAGVYAADKSILAVNRGEAEDRPAVLGDSRVAELFRGLDFDRVDDQAGNMTSLVHEIWRMCVGAMLVAIVVEAGLCLPRPATAIGDHRVTSEQAITFLATPWTLVAAVDRLAHRGRLQFRRLAAQRLSPGDRRLSKSCGSRSSALIGVILNQPEWVEEYHPSEKPSIGVLWDASTSMTTRDVVAGKLADGLARHPPRSDRAADHTTTRGNRSASG